MKKWLLLAALLASTPAIALPVDCSTKITKGGTAQWIIGTGQAGKGFMIQNIDPNEAMWFSPTGVVTPNGLGAYILAPAQARAFATSNLFIMVGTFDFTGSVSVVAATTGHKISCTMW